MGKLISRRVFNRSILAATGGAISAPAIFTSPARAAEFTIRFAHNAPVGFPTHIRAQQAAERIKQATGGRVNLLIFPNNQLGSDPEMLSQVRSGAIQMYALPGLLAQSIVPDAGIHCLAFSFKSYDDLWPAIDGPLGAFIRASMDKIGIKTFATPLDNGFRQITSRDKPIFTPADLAGFKIRTAPSPIIISIFEHLGAATTTVSIKETYAALQTKLVDGEENPLPTIDAFKFYEVQKNCALTNHVWDGFWFCVNPAYWEKLPPDLQHVVESNMNEAAKQQRQDLALFNESVAKKLAAAGLKMNQPDIGAFRQKLRESGFYDKWRKSFSEQGWTALEQAVGKLG
ncbi:tripartite ATP-independent transporter DctP family solute receptor [Rhodopseudomonas rhenobacensis]|uniref:Tripartite ATP-independent transporter DctP family solute receptor n=1 Tax=Rhodopseudomonas rhenobacensis TaxID=87461 RepID=A0A7W7Z4Z2_9BRAD|nr:TRAP transporter substrate-binding protein [Rhodopseudomonas rhenobacensis]MBB5048069.1 tripartite ATP-independent transporter DctP family solute receptor [Rhodopseudomonas rhenobacensis]